MKLKKENLNKYDPMLILHTLLASVSSLFLIKILKNEINIVQTVKMSVRKTRLTNLQEDKLNHSWYHQQTTTLQTTSFFPPHSCLSLLLQRQFRREARAEELQSPARRPHAEVLWPLPGELLGPLRHLSGVCWRKTSRSARSHLLQSIQHSLEVSPELCVCVCVCVCIYVFGLYNNYFTSS